MEKQAFALVKALKDLRVYILHSHIIVFVPNAVEKDILTQNDTDGKRGMCIAVILDYDIEIKPTKQGLTKLMAKSNLHTLDINFITALDGEEKSVQQVSESFVTSPWYTNIVYVLQHLQAPPDLKKTKERFLKLKSVKFYILLWADMVSTKKSIGMSPFIGLWS